jgi:putative ATP-dependent endonuclease of OLD family
VFALFDIDEQGRCGSEHVPIIVENLVLSSYFWDSTLAVLQELAASEQEGAPTLLLGFEEPELYQHPPQAQHIAATLEQMATSAKANAQVIVSTHSPYFVGAKGFENVRLIRKPRATKCSTVKSAKYGDVEELLAGALKAAPGKPTALMASLEQILQPSQRELFFTPVAILVEGIEDVALLSTHLHLTEKWDSFRERGCHFVTCNGKNSLSRPLAIARRLEIPAFVVFDADGDETDDEKRKRHVRDNSCILRLCGIEDNALDPLPAATLWNDSVVMWHANILDDIRSEIGLHEWDVAENAARTAKGLNEGVRRKNSLLIAATLEQLDMNGRRSKLLTRVCDAMLRFAERATPA